MDKVAKTISEALISIKDEHRVGEEEAERIAVLISAVVKSSKDIRMVFYSGAQIIAEQIQKMLKEQEKELLSKIKKEDDILN